MGVEHLVEGSNIVMREDEPSSIIAQGLNSPAYKAALREGMSASVASSAEAFMPDQPLGHGINRASNWDVLDFQTDPGTDLEEAMKKPANQIMRVVWDGEHVRCTMKVFFAHQFDALRKNCDIEELFIESLARCVKWDAVGGKSGSAFLKTRGERDVCMTVNSSSSDVSISRR
jgi:1-phosphatidylinositol-3-phosphate 5-kinase